MTVKPYSAGIDSFGKKTEVKAMFNAIAPTYDLLNRLLSFRCDIIWRRILAKKVAALNPAAILDLATGTGDVAIMLAQVTRARTTAVDIAADMLQIGIEKSTKAGLGNRIDFAAGDAENLTYSDSSFDVVTVAFGVRNYENLERGLKEMHRVLRPGGTSFVLEFSKPVRFPFKQLYQFYFKHILPQVGRLICKDQNAYMYLFKSVEAFPKGNAFAAEMIKAGYSQIQQYPLTLGVVCLYTGVK